MSTIKINGRDFHFRQDSGGDKGAINQVFSRLDYNFSYMAQSLPLLAWLGRQKHPPLIIDAGAHIGAATVWFKHQFPEARIVAVEPEPENFALLAQNTMGMEGVSTVQGAVASYNGTGYLQDPKCETWGFRVAPTQAEDEPAVKMHTMRRLMAMEPDATPFIAKVDIEGGEAELFSANTGWMDSFPLIVWEAHDWLLPGQATSRNVWQAVANRRFDVVLHEENLVMFNCDLLYP